MRNLRRLPIARWSRPQQPKGKGIVKRWAGSAGRTLNCCCRSSTAQSRHLNPRSQTGETRRRRTNCSGFRRESSDAPAMSCITGTDRLCCWRICRRPFGFDLFRLEGGLGEASYSGALRIGRRFQRRALRNRSSCRALHQKVHRCASFASRILAGRSDPNFGNTW